MFRAVNLTPILTHIRSDQFGLVRFNNVADVHCPLREWSRVNKSKLKKEIDALRAYGTTCLSAAIDCATDMFSEAGEYRTLFRV